MKRINMKVDDLKLEGRGHVLSSPDLMIKTSTKPASKEKHTETQKSLGALFTLNSYGGRYGSLIQELARKSQLGNINYLISLSSAHELL